MRYSDFMKQLGNIFDTELVGCSGYFCEYENDKNLLALPLMTEKIKDELHVLYGNEVIAKVSMKYTNIFSVMETESLTFDDDVREKLVEACYLLSKTDLKYREDEKMYCYKLTGDWNDCWLGYNSSQDFRWVSARNHDFRSSFRDNESLPMNLIKMVEDGYVEKIEFDKAIKMIYNL